MLIKICTCKHSNYIDKKKYIDLKDVLLALSGGMLK